MAILTKCYLCPITNRGFTQQQPPLHKKINELNPTDFKEGQNHNLIIQDRGVRSAS